MKKKFNMSLWVMYMLLTVLVLGISMILIGAVSALLIEYNVLVIDDGDPIFALIFILALSAMSSLVFFMVIGKWILKPIIRFKEAFQIVSKGDLDYRIEEVNRVYELEEVRIGFNAMVEEISSIETLRSDFIANVSHEFKTPLAAIEGYATLLQDPSLNQKNKDEYLNLIRTSARELSSLTGNILDLSRLENQDIILDLNYFRLDEQIRNCIVLLEDKWVEKDLLLQIELDKVEYYGSKALLAQVWQNLLDNAIKFSDVKGSIYIGLIDHEDMVEVIVKDSGSGMTKEELLRVYDKFYQVDSSRSSRGNGLGLALVKRIIDLSDASIDVSAVKGVGTTFTVNLRKHKV